LKKYRPINKNDVAKMREDAIIIMIKPRVFEIETEVDMDHRAAYIKETAHIEMGAAILTFVLGIDL